MSRKCPDCGAQRFFVKDPEDQYNVFEFDVKGGDISYFDQESERDSPEVIEETEIFCDRCAWHDKFKNLK